MDGELIDVDTIKKLAALPGREELLTKLASTLLAPIGSLARTLNEVPSKLARSIIAVRDRQETA